MALIKTGGIVTKISGKIGGTSFGTSASGAYAKNAGTPRKSITTRQKTAMALMGTTAQRWRGLTQAQRNVFIAASPDYPYINRVGDVKFYSGFAIFGQLVNNLVNIAGPILPVPLPKTNFIAPVFEGFTDPTGNMTFEFSGAQATTQYRMFMSKISSPGISNAYKNQFLTASPYNASPGTLTFSAGGLYTTRFGTAPSSGKFFWHMDAIDPNTGQIYKNIVSGSYSY